MKAALAPLRSWLVTCGCACHDAHTALRWGMSQVFGDAELLREVYLGVEGVRNGYSILHDWLGGWLSQGVRLVETPHADPASLAKVWVTLGVEPEQAEDLGQLGLLWRQGFLEVSDAYENNASLFEELSSHLLTLWRFKKSATPDGSRSGAPAARCWWRSWLESQTWWSSRSARRA